MESPRKRSPIQVISNSVRPWPKFPQNILKISAGRFNRGKQDGQLDR